MRPLEGKVAIVTGGSRGIGLATALELAKRGARVAIIARDAGRVDQARAAIQEVGSACLGYASDVADRSQMEAVVGDVLSAFGQVDILVNNAALNDGSPLLALSDTDWESGLRANLMGPFILSQLVARHMIQRRMGSVIMVSSAAARTGSTKPNYSAAKAGLLGLTRSMAAELGPHAVRVNAVLPGAIGTEFISAWSAERMEEVRRNTPLGRIGVPEDVALAIAFLASDDARFITGATLDVNGGHTMGG